jgi:hypothetical protein
MNTWVCPSCKASNHLSNISCFCGCNKGDEDITNFFSEIKTANEISSYFQNLKVTNIVQDDAAPSFDLINNNAKLLSSYEFIGAKQSDSIQQITKKCTEMAKELHLQIRNSDQGKGAIDNKLHQLKNAYEAIISSRQAKSCHVPSNALAADILLQRPSQSDTISHRPQHTTPLQQPTGLSSESANTTKVKHHGKEWATYAFWLVVFKCVFALFHLNENDPGGNAARVIIEAVASLVILGPIVYLLGSYKKH